MPSRQLSFTYYVTLNAPTFSKLYAHDHAAKALFYEMSPRHPTLRATGVTQVAAGDNHSAALSVGGGVYTWVG